MSPEKRYNVWGRRKRPEEKPYKGRRDPGRRENTDKCGVLALGSHRHPGKRLRMTLELNNPEFKTRACHLQVGFFLVATV